MMCLVRTETKTKYCRGTESTLIFADSVSSTTSNANIEEEEFNRILQKIQ